MICRAMKVHVASSEILISNTAKLLTMFEKGNVLNEEIDEVAQ